MMMISVSFGVKNTLSLDESSDKLPKKDSVISVLMSLVIGMDICTWCPLPCPDVKVMLCIVVE